MFEISTTTLAPRGTFAAGVTHRVASFRFPPAGPDVTAIGCGPAEVSAYIATCAPSSVSTAGSTKFQVITSSTEPYDSSSCGNGPGGGYIVMPSSGVCGAKSAYGRSETQAAPRLFAVLRL